MRVITINADTGKRVYSRQEVADICNVTNQTIRTWEDRGLIPASMRDENEYRYWDEDMLEEVKKYAENPVIKRGRKSVKK